MVMVMDLLYDMGDNVYSFFLFFFAAALYKFPKGTTRKAIFPSKGRIRFARKAILYAFVLCVYSYIPFQEKKAPQAAAFYFESGSFPYYYACPSVHGIASRYLRPSEL